jgi:hypothetical protein
MSVLCAYLMVRTLERNDPSTILFTDVSYSRELGLPSVTADQERSEES